VLVLGNHALHLHQQCRLWVGVEAGALEEAHPDSEALELFVDQHLVGVGAGEPVGAQAEHALEQARLGGVAQAIKRGAVKARARVAIVDELVDDLVPVRLRGGAQRLKLRSDRAALVLALAGDARVQANPHRATARKAAPAGRASRKRYASASRASRGSSPPDQGGRLAPTSEPR